MSVCYPSVMPAPPTTPLFGGPSPLSPDALKSAVSDFLNQEPVVPEGHSGALVAVVNLDKVEVVLATKVADGWTVNVVASHTWSGDNQFSVLSKTTW